MMMAPQCTSSTSWPPIDIEPALAGRPQRAEEKIDFLELFVVDRTEVLLHLFFSVFFSSSFPLKSSKAGASFAFASAAVAAAAAQSLVGICADGQACCRGEH